ncbi:M16 family metallopeptidase [Cloacibacterium sp.]|uniref:M16 family metallopeptidase n=1 Tax=Cloacibacterium sp. TaxID=1913682 RepID=UPI0039E34E08
METIIENQYITKKYTDKNGYSYKQVVGDENGVRIYTLKNGLKVYLAQNTDAPRIQTYIPVKTGSNNDPSDNTGLAHYLEHMMFKGTSKLGTLDWQKEKVLLEQISDLYEEHKAEQNPEKKKEIYRKIDEISQEASKYAIANEYDKAISSLGASGTNAHTWLDETVYKNNIPNNELEKWLKIEQNRFSDLVLRLFHTELESVYEEFNRAQDNDGRLVHYALMEELFPKHPNGQQTTLGKSEHLKNPSMKAIHQYFNDFYVPNNMAMVLVGDLEFDETILLVDKYFGELKYKELPKKEQIVEEPLTQIIEKTVKSPSAKRLHLAWRTDSYGTQEERLASVVAQILSNSGEAGLLDLNVNQNQKALRAVAYQSGFKQYGMFTMVIIPKENQSLDKAKNLLLEQIDLVKKGDFPDWLISAIVNDLKLQKLKALETADGLASELYSAFINNRTWEQELNEISEYEKITKEDVVKFAQDFFKDNYVLIKKAKGTNGNLIRVDNPGITPVKINREAQSEFLTEILNEKSTDIQPEFINYQEEIQEFLVKDKKVSFVKNRYNDIAQVHLIYNMGTDNDKELSLAIDVLQFLGTEKFLPYQLKEEFYKIGILYDFITNADNFRVSLSGLEKNIAKGLDLMKHWITSVKPETEVCEGVVQLILESREVNKNDKNKIMTALVQYAKFGEFSRFSDVISEERLSEIKVDELTDRIKNLIKFPYEIFFYGKDFEGFKKIAENYIEESIFEIPEARNYPEPETENNIYFIDYDMVQVEMCKVGRAGLVNVSNFGKINVFNEYFGRGLSSVVFQELRESKSLAYSAYVSYNNANEIGKHNYVVTYIGTQANKINLAIDAMDGLMQEMPKIELQFENAKNSALKQIATTRIKRTNIFFNYFNLRKLNIDSDVRKEVYSEIETLTINDLDRFYNSEIKPVKYSVVLIGKRENLNFEAVKGLGDLQELTLENVFGY